MKLYILPAIITQTKGGERIRSFELFKKETVSRKNTKNRLLYIIMVKFYIVGISLFP